MIRIMGEVRESMKSIETKQMYSEAIRQNIAKKDWQKLSEVMIGAELVGVAKSLRARGWRHVGEYEHGRGNFSSAVIAFNSARSLDLANKNVFGKFLGAYESFFSEFEENFSKEDLSLLIQPLVSIINFYSVHQPKELRGVDTARRLLKRLQVTARHAQSRRETPASHKVEQIVGAVYLPTMTPEEVRAEFARVLAPLIRDEYESPAKSKKKMQAGGGGKPPKPPKNGKHKKKGGSQEGNTPKNPRDKKSK